MMCMYIYLSLYICIYIEREKHIVTYIYIYICTYILYTHLAGGVRLLKAVAGWAGEAPDAAGPSLGINDSHDYKQ